MHTLAPTAAPVAWPLRPGPGAAPVVRDERGTLTRDELAGLVADAAERLSGQRRLVHLVGARTREWLVQYLAALSAGHVVLLTPPGPAGLACAEGYDPDVVIAGGRVVVRRETSAHDLHPDLALLLSTSGSTGSAKLVRLSRQNLVSNAEQIQAFLRLSPDDVAVTSLPVHYCYGLSVVHTALLSGAELLLTERSVTDPRFWSAARDAGVSVLAAVPHTFELVERAGVPLALPRLRLVTQAGGRLAPHQVLRWAAEGRRAGWQLQVMYGQTEATARMAHLPPELVETAPGAVGVPVDGGSLRLEPFDGAAPGTGELVYSGPNVMLGYARTCADLARGREVHELRTGDVGRVRPDGLLEVVGRRARHVKPFGLRTDLDHVERQLQQHGLVVAVAGDDTGIVVAVEGAVSGGTRRRVVAACGLPPAAVDVVAVAALPRRENGKVDTGAVLALRPARAGGDADAPLTELFSEVLGRPVRDRDSFATAGGDSLSYVELSVRLQERLGTLPPDWHRLPVAELARRARPARRGLLAPVRLDLTVALRAVAILLVVASHVHLVSVLGGAHVLLAVAGYNAARFTPAGDRARRLARSAWRLAVPSVLWIGAVHLLTGQYSWPTVFLVNALVGTDELGPTWQYWFLEALVALLLVVAALLAVPAVARFERRRPLGFAALLFTGGLVTRVGLVPLTGPHHVQSWGALVWLFALGWGTAAATDVRSRLLVTAGAVLAVPGFFGDPRHEAVVLAGVLALVWVRTVAVPRLVAQGAAPLAAASLWVYLVHWQVFPHVRPVSSLLALVASLAAGLVAARAAGRVTAWRQAYARTGPATRTPTTSPGVGSASGATRPRTTSSASRSSWRRTVASCPK